MQEFINFLMNHWELSALFIAVLAAILFLEVTGTSAGALNVSSAQATELMNRNQASVIDIRPPRSIFQRTYHRFDQSSF